MSNADMDRNFSFRRAGLLLRNRVLEELPALAIGLAIVVAFNLLGLVTSKRVWFNEAQAYMWAIVIVGAGLLLASQAFKGMHDGKSGTDWLLLPASPLEKYVSAVVDYLVIFPLLGSAVCMGLSALFYFIAGAMGGNGDHIWSPAEIGGFKAWGEYAIAASVCLAGSASFRKIPLLKTIAVVSAYVIVMTGLFALVGYLVFKGNGNFSFNDNGLTIDGGKLEKTAEDALLWIYKIAAFGLVPVFSLLYGYFRVFEKEARDEVQ
jgi:hypothetical protein